jgi:Oligoendopeptidase F
VVWDLSGLYGGHDDPLIEEDLQKVCKKALAFEARYRRAITEEAIDAGILLSALKEYESIYETGRRPYLFASLCHASDTRNHRRNELWQRVRVPMGTSVRK